MSDTYHTLYATKGAESFSANGPVELVTSIFEGSPKIRIERGNPTRIIIFSLSKIQLGSVFTPKDKRAIKIELDVTDGGEALVTFKEL